MDWAAHLKQLQTVLKEFDPAAAPNEEVLICYFCNGLRPSIWAQSNKRGWDLDIWEETIKKAIDVEAKRAYQPQFLMKEMVSCCPQYHRFFKTDRSAREQKDSNSHKSKHQKQKAPAHQRSNNAETLEKTQKEKKKNNQRNRRDGRA